MSAFRFHARESALRCDQSLSISPRQGIQGHLHQNSKPLHHPGRTVQNRNARIFATRKSSILPFQKHGQRATLPCAHGGPASPPGTAQDNLKSPWESSTTTCEIIRPQYLALSCFQRPRSTQRSTGSTLACHQHRRPLQHDDFKILHQQKPGPSEESSSSQSRLQPDHPRARTTAIASSPSSSKLRRLPGTSLSPVTLLPDH